MSDIAIGTRIGPYQVESVLPGHRGGFARVVLARRISGGEKQELVAIKVARTDVAADSDPEIYARALGNEVETLRVLKHPGIVRLYPIKLDERRYSYMARAVHVPGNPWYYVMEYLAGGTVEDLIRQEGVLDPKLAVEIAHQVGVALDYIHTSGYAHLDVKTNNIALRQPLVPGAAPQAVLIDFGAAQKALRRAEVEAGALVYLPPERVQVLTGSRSPETVANKAAVDVYSLGVTLYRMLTGELPFHGKRDHVTTAILNEVPTNPMQINRKLVALPELDALIMEMLEKDPARRPAIKEVLTRLDQAVMPPRFGHISPEAERHAQATIGKGWKYAALVLGLVAALEGGGLAASLGTRPLGGTQPTALAPTPTSAVVATSPSPAAPAVTATPAPMPTRTPRPPTRVSPTPIRTATFTPAPLESEPTLIPTYTPIPTRPWPTNTPVSLAPSSTQG